MSFKRAGQTVFFEYVCVLKFFQFLHKEKGF